MHVYSVPAGVCVQTAGGFITVPLSDVPALIEALRHEAVAQRGNAHLAAHKLLGDAA